MIGRILSAVTILGNCFSTIKMPSYKKSVLAHRQKHALLSEPHRIGRLGSRHQKLGMMAQSIKNPTRVAAEVWTACDVQSSSCRPKQNKWELSGYPKKRNCLITYLHSYQEMSTQDKHVMEYTAETISSRKKVVVRKYVERVPQRFYPYSASEEEANIMAQLEGCDQVVQLLDFHKGPTNPKKNTRISYMVTEHCGGGSLHSLKKVWVIEKIFIYELKSEWCTTKLEK